ncbi:MAG: CopD family protein [Alphaproteobacteria bacterium]|nr:CopD family protein [Alphaproteobacteria bacterium]MBL7097486.1 CopD family protein [Alphaproteobacteria bacterium]
MTLLYGVARALHFASVMGVFGATALLFQRPEDGAVFRRLLAWAAWIAPVAAATCLCFAAGEMTADPSSVADPATVWVVATSTIYGHVFVARLALLIGLGLLCSREGLYLAKASVSGAALVLASLTSHAAASGEAFALHAAVDALHLLTAGFWFGGLLVLARETIAAPRDLPKLIGLLRAFSRWGAPSVAVLLAAGTANSFFILGPPGMQWATGYVVLLAAKIVLAAIMVALALTNRFGVLPGLERGDKEAGETIPLTVIAELSCAAMILAIVGFLGVISPMQM